KAAQTLQTRKLPDEFAAAASRAAEVWSALELKNLRNLTLLSIADTPAARRLGGAGLAPAAEACGFAMRPDGSFGRALSADARDGLAALGVMGEPLDAIVAHVEGRRTLRGAPGVSLDTLRERGLSDAALEAIEEAASDALNLRAAVHPIVIG